MQAVHDLTQLVTTTKEKYAALAKNDEVTKALAGLDPAIKPRPQLGPSHGFHENVKLAERFEKDAAQSPAEPKAKAITKSKRARIRYGPHRTPESKRHAASPLEHSPSPYPTGNTVRHKNCAYDGFARSRPVSGFRDVPHVAYSHDLQLQIRNGG